LPRTVNYDDVAIEFESIEPAGGEGTNRWFRVESRHAHRRAAVRALFESRGLKVSRVIQVQFADIELPRDLPRGRHRALKPERVEALYVLAGLEPPQSAEQARGAQRKPGRRSRTGAKSSGRRPSTGRRKSGR
jgi:23S rRNA pseudouridine2605 synthase